jgi:hypothetical protein
MAWTLNALKAAVEKELEPTGDDFFDGMFPTFVRQAEERILHVAKVPPFRRRQTFVNVNAFVAATLPDIMAPIVVVMDGGSPLLLKETSWIAEVFGTTPAPGSPVAYAMRQSDADQQVTEIVLAPPPIAPTNMLVEYFAKPPSLADSADPDADVTWISTNAENALFYGVLFHAYTYQKGEADILAGFGAEFEKAMSLLKGMQMGERRTDENRASPQARG